MKEKPGRVERKNRWGRAINLLLNFAVLLLLGVGAYLTVEFGLQLLGQHRLF